MSERRCRVCGKKAGPFGATMDEFCACDQRTGSTFDDDGTPEEWALREIAHLVRHEYWLKDHDPFLVLNTIGKVLDAYDAERRAGLPREDR